MGAITQLSPGIITSEIDLTAIVPAVSTTAAALAGVFRWGPLDSLVSIDSETTLKNRFLGPSNFNAETWFTGSNFLGYGNNLIVSRAGDYTGNTVNKTFVGNATSLAITANSNVLNLSNTAGLAANMVLFYSNTADVVDALSTSMPPTILQVLNSSAVEISENATANVQSIAVTFRDNIVYTAVAQETQDITIDWDNQIVRNEDEYQNVDGLFDISVLYVARYAGGPGNSLRISVCDHPTQFSSNISLQPNASFNAATSVIAATVGSNTLVATITPLDTSNTTQVSSANDLASATVAQIAVRDLIQVGNSRIGYQYLKVANVGSVTAIANVFSFTIQLEDEVKLGANTSSNTIQRYWEFYNFVDRAPGTSAYVTQFGNSAALDELHIVVVDEDGVFSSSPGTVIEVHKNVSRATDAKTIDNSTNYYKEVINQQSQCIWFANDRTTAPSNTAEFITSSTATAPLEVQLYGGSDGPDEATVPLSTLTFAYDKFQSPEAVDISLVLQGKARGESASYYTQLGNYILDNICIARTDCIAFISPYKEAVVNNKYGEAEAIVNAKSVSRDTSYGVFDSGYKYQYDRYNDVYRWIPLNGDIAGLCVRTDQTNDAWWSPAGFKRGQIKNVVRLAYNPRKNERDTLYKNGVNPVVAFPNQGTILYGDKTMQFQASAFDRINVRRLFIVLRKAISLASRGTLFEFNDDFTRAQFKSIVNPYLKDVQGRRGITDFYVKCDADNNTPQIRMSNQFVGDIYIKPNHSINYITLNFVAVRDDVAFSEVIGKFG
jgi:hypothetical protein